MGELFFVVVQTYGEFAFVFHHKLILVEEWFLCEIWEKQLKLVYWNDIYSKLKAILICIQYFHIHLPLECMNT